jgi:transglutaminase-like putative cysteine protease
MHRLLTALLSACVLTSGNAFGQSNLLEQASRLEQNGHFKRAASLLTNSLANYKPSDGERKAIEFELDRLARIKQDFPLTKKQLFAELKKSLKELTSHEFELWINEGRFDSREIDGERFFMVSSVSNLFFRYPSLNTRRRPPKQTATYEKAVWENCVQIEAAARTNNKPYVLPKRFHVTMTVTADADAAPAGQTISAWLPIPRRYPFQDEFQLCSSSSPIRHQDPDQSSIRAIFLQQPATSRKPTQFKIEYNYTTWGVFFDIDPSKIQSADSTATELKTFKTQAPHIAFTPEMLALSSNIAGAEPNPCLRAKKFYDWIADHIQYSYAIEYSTIRNIGEYCRSKAYGDCGQEALLFITLCRLNGIPARWQSGWNTFPGAKSIHDWSEIFLAPYGWIPVDPYMGVFAMRYANSLSPEQKRELRDFYFGGLDQYRMAANSDHCQTLTPDKNSMRSDNVDFQRGELEWDNHNIYFDHYSWELNREELPSPAP